MDKPFQKLGVELKAIRQNLRESVAEVSGAVEIDIDVLERIEIGQERPSEEVLMLLISHFGMPDDDAVELWDLAGYGQPPTSKNNRMEADLQNRPVVMMMALDTRILYSDSAHINANKNGVVLNFLQNAGQPNQQVPIARIGMSYVQAQELLSVMHQTLSQAEAMRQPKNLPAPKSRSTKDKKPDSN